MEAIAIVDSKAKGFDKDGLDQGVKLLKSMFGDESIKVETLASGSVVVSASNELIRKVESTESLAIIAAAWCKKPKAFVDLEVAAGKLVAAGFAVRKIMKKFSGLAQESCCLVANDVIVTGGYRDGASWKFKLESIDDFIDNNDPSVVSEPVEVKSCYWILTRVWSK